MGFLEGGSRLAARHAQPLYLLPVLWIAIYYFHQRDM
jgi:hypothetical protein